MYENKSPYLQLKSQDLLLGSSLLYCEMETPTREPQVTFILQHLVIISKKSVDDSDSRLKS